MKFKLILPGVLHSNASDIVFLPHQINHYPNAPECPRP